MTYTWGDAQAELGRLLRDEGPSLTYSETLRRDAYNHALEAFAAVHTAVATATSFTGDGDTTQFTLPNNAITEGTYYLWSDEEERWLSPIYVMPNNTVPVPALEVAGKPEKFTYYEWPEGTLILGYVPVDAETLTVYYYAYWDQVEDDSDVIAIPRWAREALLCYAAAYCLSPRSTGSANIRQFNTKQDSGQPEHNPLAKQREMFLKRWYEILATVPPQQKAPPFRGFRT